MLVGDCPNAGATNAGPPDRIQTATISNASNPALTHNAASNVLFDPDLAMNTLMRPHNQSTPDSATTATSPMVPNQVGGMQLLGGFQR
jgi:hypothetical protein